MLETMQRAERRYLIADPSDLLAVLGEPDEAYDVTTDYLLDGDPSLKYRMRYYGDAHLGYFENKVRVGNQVTKQRIPSPVCRGEAPPGFHVIGEVTYHRQAWAIGDVRVTLDTDVRHDDIRLTSDVLEVKGDTVPDSLAEVLPAKAKGFSKRSWMLEGQE